MFVRLSLVEHQHLNQTKSILHQAVSPRIINCSNTREQAESQEEEENEDDGEDRNSHDESMCIDNYIYICIQQQQQKIHALVNII